MWDDWDAIERAQAKADAERRERRHLRVVPEAAPEPLEATETNPEPVAAAEYHPGPEQPVQGWQGRPWTRWEDPYMPAPVDFLTGFRLYVRAVRGMVRDSVHDAIRGELDRRQEDTDG